MSAFTWPPDPSVFGAKDLPDRIEEDLFCEIEGEQKTLYRAELKTAQQMLLRIKTQKEFAQERFHFLTSLLRLRHTLLHLPCQVWHEADHALQHHQLAAMVHFVFLGREQHLEARPRRRFGRRC